MNELEAEGELAEQEELDRQLLKVGPLPDTPAAEPAQPVPAAASKAKPKPVEEDDLAELSAWAS